MKMKFCILLVLFLTVYVDAQGGRGGDGGGGGGDGGWGGSGDGGGGYSGDGMEVEVDIVMDHV
jgi:hypothetical protein